MPVPEHWAKSSRASGGGGSPTHHPSATANEWWNLFTDARRTRRNPATIFTAVGIAVVVLISVIVAVWMMWRPSVFRGASDTVSVAPAPQLGMSQGSAADSRLVHLLPSGYRPDSCAPVATPDGAAAKVTCGQSAVPGGPASGMFTLVRDNATLVATFDDLLRRLDVVTCPGNIQSPGPWHTAAEQHTGTLVCGIEDNMPTVAWTNDGQLLLSIVQTSPQGPSLDDLYRWWSTQQ
jgi:hypothetical protein